MTRWGIVSTIKAPETDILNFAAYHLERGAHRLYIYLDVPDTQVFDTLRAHPKIKVVACDDTWWAKRKGRPEKHQTRQFMNARHAYNRKVEVDWLAHIDVDEFLWPTRNIADQLSELPAECQCARVRPIEALATPDNEPNDAMWFKAFHLDPAKRRKASERCFPTYGRYLSGGFLSHVAGKLFYRTGVQKLQVKIHNIYVGDVENPGERPLPEIELCHLHAKTWEDWQRTYHYRMRMGSYRPELKAQVNRGNGGLSLNQVFSMIEEDGGEVALRNFYDEVCVATPNVRHALQQEGLLRQHNLDLEALRMKHFGGAG